MALEALAVGVSRTQLVLELLERWRKEVEELLKELPQGSEDAESLYAVRRELLFRRDDSVRRQIHRLVGPRCKRLATMTPKAVQGQLQTSMTFEVI